MASNEPPKLKTILKTPPKQATNPLQFVKVGPCSLYRSAQEQIQKVQEIKKIEQKIREDPEDWQSNLDNWKSSRRKRQEHIIERVVEVKKLELEEQDRIKRRSKTFSEIVEERGKRKLAPSLSLFQEEDNDLSDLGITSSAKNFSSVEVLEDDYSSLDNGENEPKSNLLDTNNTQTDYKSAEKSPEKCNKTIKANEIQYSKNICYKKKILNNNVSQERTLTTEKAEEFTYEGAIRGYVSRIAHNISQDSITNLNLNIDDNSKPILTAATFFCDNDNKTNDAANAAEVVRVDIRKRREIFEKNGKNQEISQFKVADSKPIPKKLPLSVLKKPEIEEEKLNLSHEMDSNKSQEENFYSKVMHPTPNERDNPKPLEMPISSERLLLPGIPHNTTNLILHQSVECSDASLSECSQSLEELDLEKLGTDSSLSATLEDPITSNVNFFVQQPRIQCDEINENKAADTPLAKIDRQEQDLQTEAHVLKFEQEVPPLPVIRKIIVPSIFTNSEDIISQTPFPMGPAKAMSPPKEKPPPPPNEEIEPLKRLNSTKRIKKELRMRRSDFLGIEGIKTDDLDPVMTLPKALDIATILSEERRVEQSQRCLIDTDSNYEQDSSHERDSGVELGHIEDWTKLPVSPDISQHSRQSSEPFVASITSSEEDEITKKEREIIDVLQKEEQWRYENNRQQNRDMGEKLAFELRKLEEEKMQMERDRATQTAGDQNFPAEEHITRNKENLCQQENVLCQLNITNKQNNVEDTQKKILKSASDDILQKNANSVKIHKNDLRQVSSERNILCNTQNQLINSALSISDSEFETKEVERELLQLEQEELERQRRKLAYKEQKQRHATKQLEESWKSLQDVSQLSPTKSVTPQNNSLTTAYYRFSLPNLQIPDNKRKKSLLMPTAVTRSGVSAQQRLSHSSLIESDSRVSKIPIKMNVSPDHQKSRQSLQIFSAVPKNRIAENCQKSDVLQKTNETSYQHWLKQKEEYERITEQNLRGQAMRKQECVSGSPASHSFFESKDVNKPLPESIINSITKRVRNRIQEIPLLSKNGSSINKHHTESQDIMLSVSGKKKCSYCGDELGRGAAMIIESLRLFYHMECFKCCVCHMKLGDGLMGTDVRVRNHNLHCHNCYSNDDGVKFSCV